MKHESSQPKLTKEWDESDLHNRVGKINLTTVSSHLSSFERDMEG